MQTGLKKYLIAILLIHLLERIVLNFSSSYATAGVANQCEAESLILYCDTAKSQVRCMGTRHPHLL